MFAPWADRLLERIELSPGDRVLDVCCGTGAVARRAAAVVGRGRVVGVDLSEAMIEVARLVAGGDAIDWRVGDALALPVGDEEFDVALCQFGLMFVSDRVAALAELARVVRPGGRLGVLVWGQCAENPAQEAVAAASDAVGRLDPMMNPAFSLGDPEELADLAEAGGWRDVDVRVEELMLPVGMWDPDKVLERQLQMSPHLWAEASPEDRQHWLDIVDARLRPYRDRGSIPSRANLLIARR